MKRVASLYLPNLSIERLRRGRSGTLPSAAEPSTQAWVPTARIPENTKERQQLVELRQRLGEQPSGEPGQRIEDCSCPKAGGWRPGARWASREARQAEIDSMPAHQRPPMRMLGRRSEPAAPVRFSREGGSPASNKERRSSAAWTPAFAGEPLATTQRTGNRILLSAVSAEAAALGLRPGMPATQARALVPELELVDADPQADLAILNRLALFAARRWTPIAAVSAPDGLWLNLSGTAHLFGGEERMSRRIVAFCARLGFTARIAIAGTTGAAHALARFGRQPVTLCGNGDEAQAISALPPAALRLEPQALSAARRFGIDRLGDLLAVPRGPLARRFGQTTVTRIDQAIGRVGEPFAPIVPEEPPRALLRLLEPIGTAEAIAQVIGDLMALLVARLEQDGLAVRRLLLNCHRVDGEEQRLEIGTVAATRDAAHLVHLLSLKIESIDPGFGIEAMELVAVRCEPLRAVQLGTTQEEASLPPLVDRIAGRIGASRLFRLTAQESDVPERSTARTGPLATPAEWPRDWPRPVRMLIRPEPVDKVLAELPDQPPLRFSWRGRTYRVRKADGPERIFGEWWRRTGEADAVRDYFRLEDEGGARFWLFRRGDGLDPKTGDLSWWMHGLFG